MKNYWFRHDFSLETILRYVAGSSDKMTAEKLTQVVKEVLEEGEKLMPTIAEQWFEQGRQEGLVLGLEQGREEGREEGREAALTILRRFLAMRFGLELTHFDAKFASLDLTAITKLSEVAFKMESLVEFETALAQLPPDPPAKSDSQADTSLD